MIDPKLIRESPDAVRNAMFARGVDVDVNELNRMDGQWRHVLQEIEDARAEQNKASADPSAKENRENLKDLKHRIKSREMRLQELELLLHNAIAALPNIPLPDTPVGAGSAANVVEREWGAKPSFGFTPKHYLEIAEPSGAIDMESGAKVSGARFGYLTGWAALLEFALIQYAVSRLTDESFIADVAAKAGLDVPARPFIPVIPPVMVRKEMMNAMGFSERIGTSPGNDEMYWLDKDELYLVGTSEQSIGPMHYDTIVEAARLPLRYVGFSTCFRREAGAAGKDTRGILRVHQFDKLEMFTVCEPGASEAEHRFLLACQEALVQGLGLHYRVLRLCTGDLGAAAAATFDIETWMPGQNEYRETHSTSNTTDYQSRSLKSRYRIGEKQTELTHMLNGTAFALGRMIIAVVENCQTEKGTVAVPEALKPFLGGRSELA
ncbi:MAG TPA: serine--tRNA ligase [Candidatus Paceibacterota bacterium]|nr:serine--tRNA ligase [Candidatus Paceibacterota bacterium]